MDGFDHKDWLRRFEAAAQTRDGFRELRKEVFSGTVRIVKGGGYIVGGHSVKVRSESVTENTVFYRDALRLGPSAVPQRAGFSVINADCLETAKVLLAAGQNPCVLNMASRKTPGGGVLNGSGAQEENLFRRTNLFVSMYQFADFSEEYGIRRSKHSYPMDSDFNGIYSPGITVFRGSEANGYCLLREPYRISVVSVAAVSHPDLEYGRDGECLIAPRHAEQTKNRIRTILRIAASHGHDSLVLSAFGCGAFANPPRHMASLFREVFAEAEFGGYFKTVVFSIIDDSNSRKKHNPDGNVLPFLEVFGR